MSLPGFCKIIKNNCPLVFFVSCLCLLLASCEGAAETLYVLEEKTAVVNEEEKEAEGAVDEKSGAKEQAESEKENENTEVKLSPEE